MSSNLSLQYDEVLSYLIEYDRFVGQLNSPLRVILQPPRRSLALSFRALREWSKRPRFLTLRQTPSEIEFANMIATEEERKQVFFAIYNSEFLLDALSENLKLAFPDCDFAKIKELHTARTAKVESVSKDIYLLYGYVLTLALVFMNSVPRAVVKHFGFDFDSYQIKVFWITVFTLTIVTVLSMFIGPMEWYLQRGSR